MLTFILLSEYKTITSFYFIIINVNINKLANIHLKKFNYKKIFYKERMIKFNKKKTVIKNL